MKEIEKRDAVLTSAQQIDRLLRPGSKYSNLNPFEVFINFYTANTTFAIELNKGLIYFHCTAISLYRIY